MRFIGGLLFSLRLFQKNLSTSLIAVFVLATGLSLSITMFSLVKTILWDAPDIKVNGELVSLEWVAETIDSSNNFQFGLNIFDFEYFEDHNTSFEAMTAYQFVSNAIYNPDESNGVKRYSTARTNSNFFDVLGMQPLLGRTYTAGEGDDENLSVVISYKVWKAEFNGDADAIGKLIQLDGVPHEVLGVMPKGFAFPVSQQLWKPYDWRWERPQGRKSSLRVIPLAVLKENVTVEAASLELMNFASQLSNEYPETNKQLKRIKLGSFDRIIIDDTTRGMLISLLIGAILVLMVACANVSNILLARSGKRQFELAMRKVLGASRLEIVAQILYDAIVISTMGMFLALLLSGWGVRTIWNILTSNYDGLPYWWEMKLDADVFAFGFSMLLLSVLVSSASVVAKALSKYSADSLKDNARTTSGLSASRLSRVLVSLQVIFTTILISVGISFVLLVQDIKNRQLNIEPEKIMINSIYVGAESGFSDGGSVNTFFDTIAENIRAIPGISHVAFGFTVSDDDRRLKKLAIDGRTLGTQDAPVMVSSNIVYSSFFDMYDAKPLLGRFFTPTDDDDSNKVVVVDEEFVRTYFPDENPIGKRIKIFEPGNDWEPQNRIKEDKWTEYMTIIGVTPSLVSSKGVEYARKSGNVSRYTTVYIPARQYISRVMGMMIRADDNVEQYAKDVSQVIASQSTKVAPFNSYMSLKESLRRNDLFLTLLMNFVLIFASVALVMASAGLYGLASFSAMQKMREYGIHMALGASKKRIFTMVLVMAKWQLAIGLLLGLTIAHFLGTASLQQFQAVTNAQPINLWLVNIVSIVGVAGVMFFALALPAARAANMPPKFALAYEG